MRDERIADADVRICREPSCRAEIVFAETPAGKLCPIDVEPNGAGKYYLAAWAIARPNPSQLKYLLGEATDEPDEPRFISHFATCPEPSRFSKKGH